jgi:ElaB/YqjD/DUF883 family membrane-anchored ribosome-binding protein
MSENLPGSAGPALAAHSKDASAPGPTEASRATNGADQAANQAEGIADTVNQWSGQAREAAERVRSTVSDATNQASKAMSEQGGQTLEQVAQFVREQPLLTLAATGAVCLALGMLLARG